MIKFLLVSFLLGLTTFPIDSLACSCKGSYTLKQEMKTSNSIFTAKVRKGMRNGIWSYEFAIENAWKGFALRSNYATKSIIVNKSSCDYFFEDGETYLIFADRVLQNNEIDVTTCSRTVNVRKANELLKVLGQPKATHKEIVIGRE